MQLLSRSTFQLLAETVADPCLSLYLPGPTSYLPPQHQREQFAQLLQNAYFQLRNRNLSKNAIQHFMKPATAVLGREEFWTGSQDGIALYLTPDGMHGFRLPLVSQPLVWVGDRFYLKPLMPLMAGREYGYVLTLKEQQIQFYQVTETAISKISLFQSFLPSRHSPSKNPDSPYLPNSQERTITLTLENRKAMRQIFAQVNATLHTYLSLEETPLLLIAGEALQRIYRSINTYSNTVTVKAENALNTLSQEELHHFAWEQIKPLLQRSQQDDIQQFQALQLSGSANAHLEHIIPAAYRGHVKTLFVTSGRQYWGQINPTSHSLEQINDTHPQDMGMLVDLLELAAIQTFLHGGTVYTLSPDQMPVSAPIAAIYHPSVQQSLLGDLQKRISPFS